MRVTREVGHTAPEWFARGTQVRYRLPGFATSEFLADCDSEEHAALIAAAPELLKALRVLIDHAQEQYPHFESERGQRDIQTALAAISKAEGGQS